ncbi:MAG: ATPase [Ruminococcus sp.]|nr:ATPase [Ruminococcus sp.]
MQQINDIEAGRTAIGIEFGSTRIKAVLTGSDNKPLAVGGHTWENRLENGIWTYSKEDIISGLQAAYSSLCEEVERKFGITLKTTGAIGISAMMHGYIALDKNDELLVPFRTWRNNTTSAAAKKLSELFEFNIPERWSIAHLYQAMLDSEPHLTRLKRVFTLAGYVHYLLTDECVLGIGDASGMFPVDSKTLDYDKTMQDKFDKIISSCGYDFKISEIFPDILCAGKCAGHLTAKGARLLDPSGNLSSGIPLCPPEGDAGTGMTATNSVLKRTGNVSAGTSVFAMVVLEDKLKNVYPQIDMVTTPDGSPVAMVHANNCTSEINCWAALFQDVLKAFGQEVSPDKLYSVLYSSALNGEKDGGGLLPFGYISGENITATKNGRPLLLRSEDASLTLSNLMRSQMYSALGALKIGLDILFEKEGVRVDKLNCHGGFFKTPIVGQKIMTAAANVKTSLTEEAGEGGAWGMALLAAFMNSDCSSLADFLNEQVFADSKTIDSEPDEQDVLGFEKFMQSYKSALPLEQAAADYI